ncbi:MAG: hypothetical protein JXR73_00715 [Candidatus Omnitrophica bacterium]|nr:hypothetical protein [Candidatus Omnitrophota bacterium]
MYPIPGHLAMSLAGARLTKLPYTPAIAATFAVDVLDKIFSDVLAIAPYGRCWFHTLLSVAVCSVLVGKLINRRWGYSWMIGHFLHLIGDIGFIPWFYPLISYHWPDAPNVVAVSVQGVQETLSGMTYSEPVKSVFVGRYLLIEFSLLLSACLMLIPITKKTKPVWIVALISFCLIMSFRLLYDLPVMMDSVSVLVGDWIRL